MGLPKLSVAPLDSPVDRCRYPNRQTRSWDRNDPVRHVSGREEVKSGETPALLRVSCVGIGQLPSLIHGQGRRPIVVRESRRLHRSAVEMNRDKLLQIPQPRRNQKTRSNRARQHKPKRRSVHLLSGHMQCLPTPSLLRPIRLTLRGYLVVFAAQNLPVTGRGRTALA